MVDLTSSVSLWVCSQGKAFAYHTGNMYSVLLDMGAEDAPREHVDAKNDPQEHIVGAEDDAQERVGVEDDT